MTKHIMKLNPNPFNKIKCGNKKYELRLYDEKRQQIHVGDIIEFVQVGGADICNVRVTSIQRFAVFADLYAILPLKDLGYGEDEIATASHNDMAQYYSAEQQNKCGVVAIGIELLTD